MPPIHFGRYHDIASAVAERLLAEPTLEVIVAGAGVRQAILTELLRKIPSGVTAVRLERIEPFAQRLLNDAGEYPRIASDAERRLAMRTAVRSIDDPLLESRGVASMLERSYRDVRDSGLTLKKFESRSRGRGRTAVLTRVWREYERLITALGAIDPADLLRVAAGALARQSPRPILVAGFYDMTVVQRRLVEALPGAELFVPITDHEDYAFARAFLVEKPEAGAGSGWGPGMTPHSIRAYPTRTEELRDVCASIAELLKQGVKPGEIGIAARSLEPHDADVINRAAAEHGFATTAENETPLLAHRIGRGVAMLLRLRERGFARREVFELLRSGLRVTRRIDVDAADLDTRGARIAGGTSSELRPLAKTPLVDDYIAVIAELEALTSDLTKWPAFIALFDIETPLDRAAADALEDIAALFQRAQVWRKPFDVNALLDALEQTRLQTANRKPQTVFAGDIMRMRGRTFAHLFAIKLQDDVFPQRRTDDPLLPDSDRRAIGVREIGDGRDEERLLFRLLLDSTEAIHFSLAGGDGFGKPLRPSPLLKSFAIAQQPERRTELLKNFIANFATTPAPSAPSPATSRQLQLIVKSGSRSPFDGFVTPSPRFAGVLSSVTPTKLEDFGECPQKFLFKHILGAVDIEDPERELQMHQREKGTLLHDILERFYKSRHTLDLNVIIDEAFDRIEEKSPPFNRVWRDIERRATKRTLAQFVAADLAELDRAQLTPKFFEYRFGRRYAERGRADRDEPFAIETNGITINVEGRIDRIDAGAGGALRIVDYKSGKALRHVNLDKKIDRGVRLQLAVYAMAVAEFFGTNAEQISGAIKPLVIGGAKPEKFAFALNEKTIRLRETIDLFAASILRGEFPAFPGADDDDVNGCKYCPVAHSCRTKHDSEERYAARRFGDPRTMLGGER